MSVIDDGQPESDCPKATLSCRSGLDTNRSLVPAAGVRRCGGCAASAAIVANESKGRSQDEAAQVPPPRRPDPESIVVTHFAVGHTIGTPVIGCVAGTINPAPPQPIPSILMILAG